MRLKIFLFISILFFIISCSQDEKPSVKVHQQVSPVLIGKDANPVLRIAIEVDSLGQNQTVNRMSVNTKGTTDISDIKKTDMYYTGTDSSFSAADAFGEPQQPGETLRFSGEQLLQPGTNYFWVSYTLNPGIDLLHRVDARLESVRLSGGIEITSVSGAQEGAKRVGVALRQRGEGGVHTYRIPGLVTTNEGTLIAAYDIRHEGSADLQGDIDVGINRSTDGGKSWEQMQVIMDMDEWGGLPEDQNGVGDPSILVDEQTGTIWVAALWTHGMPGGRAWDSSGPGLEPAETGQFVVVKSEDDGRTWSEPMNITKQIKRPEWRLLLQGPGKGITMGNGTLVFPAQFRAADGKPYSTIIYSEDHGASWEIGTGAKSNTTEAQVVELSDGSLMLNMRDNRGGSRSVYTTEDLGQTWQKHPTSRSALQEPVCQASLIQFPSPDSSRAHWLLFSNPNSTEERKNMTIKLSTDDGNSWKSEHQLLLNEDRGFGYSCLTPVDDQTVGILYEGVRELYFQKVTLKEVMEKQ
ncbi:sialidase family protein [Fodinibius salsisoli]|uniref:exo-alpha-sialidase n=1 Tax=Fodinibius salsisoli TaxID=2820877 RepID=A0ABT3PSK5_9BACT|nr:sialidase family protein [Fodinibius salsisoli]MCW9708821.1 exo-alpha-sialidase [Fodinibius salsisoli]